MKREAVVAGALQDFAAFVSADPPGVLDRLQWPLVMRHRLEAFCLARGLDFREIDHEWRKALGD